MKLKFLFLSLAFVFFASMSLFAAAPPVYKKDVPSWVVKSPLVPYKPSSREISNGYFISQLEEQVNLVARSRFRRAIRDIVSDAGVQNGSEISVDFDPSYEKLFFHKIVVWRDGKALDRLDLSDFKVIADEKELSKFIYQGNYNASLTLKDIRKGDRIEYSYSIEGWNPIFGNKFSDFFYFQEYEPVSHQYHCVITPARYSLSFRYFNGAVRPKVVNNGKEVRYEWEAFRLKALEYEENTPSWYENCPYIQVSNFRNWKEVATWAAEINPVPATLNGELGLLVERIKRESATKEELFRKAVSIVQNEVRYMGVEIGEYSHRANAPEKVFARRFGDCKDKSVLLAAMLRSAGIEASMALVNTDARERTDRYLPAPVFDHAVVRAVVNGRPVWVDPTISYQGGRGADIYFPDYGKALLVNEQSSALTGIPVSDHGKEICEEKYFVINCSAPVDLTVKTTYTRYEADKMRDDLASESIKDIEKRYLDYYASSYPKIKAKDTLVVQDDYERNQLTVIEKYRIWNFFTRDSVLGNFNASFYADCISNRLPKIEPNRRQPVFVKFPFDVDYTIRLILPGGWNVETESQRLKRNSYVFQSDYYASDDVLKLHYQFKYLKDYVPVEEMSQFSSDIRKMKNDLLMYDIVYTPDEVPFYPNYGLIVFALILITIFCIAAWFIYCRESENFWYRKIPAPLGAGPVVVCLGLAGTVVYFIRDFISEEYLDLNHWNAYSSMSSSLFYKVLLTVGAFTDVYIVCFALFCLVLILKRRDILPGIIVFYFISSSILLMVSYVLSAILYGSSASSMDNVVYSIIMTIISVSYFNRSDAVKATFVVPYIRRADPGRENEEPEGE